MTVTDETGASEAPDAALSRAGTARPGGRLRRVAGGRRRVVKVTLSSSEEEWLVPRAAALGVSVQRLLVESAMAGGPAPAAERRALYRVLQTAARDVHGVAVNVNQMARWGNEHHQLPAGVGEVVARFEVAQAALAAAAERVVARLTGADTEAS